MVTQNLSRSKFILWVDAIPQDLSILKSVLQYIEIKVYDFEEQMTRSGIWRWYLEQGSNLHERPVPVSDLVRLTLLHNYGGMWIDSDCMFLRDITPLYLLPFSWYVNMHLIYQNISIGLISFIFVKNLPLLQ